MGKLKQMPPVRHIDIRLPRDRAAIRRWPLQPLLDLAIVRYQPIVERTGDALVYSRQAVKAALGISGTTAARIEEHGLTDDQADRYAVMLGYHPSEVWGPDWFYAAMTPDDWHEINVELGAAS